MVATNKGWIAVDLDGTLADYTDGWKADDIIGDPVPEMFDRVRRWMDEGREIRIFTARVWPIATYNGAVDVGAILYPSAPEEYTSAIVAADAIHKWSLAHFGVAFPITCVKDKRMVELYDDRCVQVVANTGQLVGGSSRGVTP